MMTNDEFSRKSHYVKVVNYKKGLRRNELRIVSQINLNAQGVQFQFAIDDS